MSSQNMPDIMREVTPDYSKASPTAPGNDIYFYIKMFLGLIVLALLGYNILNYLADGTDILTDFLKKLGLGIEHDTKKIVKTVLPPLKKKKLKKVSNVDIYNEELEDELQKDIDNQSVNPKKKVNDVMPTKNNNSIIKPSNKKGYCYIGTDRTYRSCVKVEESDQCMSGQIFPTKDLCINPAVRSFN
uniref:Uncharacterized protein n=1 Tax=viral metagenome TaxID=1070528 RepID=A0A6C0C4D4_9ZZZZ